MSLASQLLSRMTVPPGPCLSARKRGPWPDTCEPAGGPPAAGGPPTMYGKLGTSALNAPKRSTGRREVRRLWGQYMDVVLLVRRMAIRPTTWARGYQEWLPTGRSKCLSLTLVELATVWQAIAF